MDRNSDPWVDGKSHHSSFGPVGVFLIAAKTESIEYATIIPAFESTTNGVTDVPIRTGRGSFLYAEITPRIRDACLP